MLNRYGLFDITKWMSEQEAPQGIPPATSGDSAAALPPDASAPPAPEEGPDEKIEKQKKEANTDDLASFRRKHAAVIYQLTKGGDNASLRELRDKFSESGIDKPFITIFNQSATGMEGSKHIARLASLHGGSSGQGRAEFQSPGSAQEFADALNDLYDDQEFTADGTSVTYKKGQSEEEPDESAPSPQKPQRPAQPLEIPPT